MSYATRSGSLAECDPEIAALIDKETKRKEYSLELIPSENCVSVAVLEAIGSILTDKYCEGYPGKRYYGGCMYYDEVERLAQARACEMFGVEEANVQPHAGSNANMAVYFGLLQPGDTILGPRLDHGGHLTHGSPVNFSGRFFKVVSYGVNLETHRFEAEEVLRLAKEHRPKLIICGATAYSRAIDWTMFRRAADEVGARVMADVAHYAGLIVGGAYPSPVPHVDVVTSTTHKTLRGPRGGIILGRAKEMKAINKSVFPGIQGGPLMNHIAAKAVAFREALQDDFKVYARQVVANARALATGLQRRGFSLLAGGTDSHMMVIDLRSLKQSGADVEKALGKVGITVNKNTVPNDPNPPAVTSGVRLGTPTMTTRGMGEAEMDRVAAHIARAVEAIADETALVAEREKVVELCKEFPLYPRWRVL
jgi:glycine hydroxymethyltransferase